MVKERKLSAFILRGFLNLSLPGSNVYQRRLAYRHHCRDLV